MSNGVLAPRGNRVGAGFSRRWVMQDCGDDCLDLVDHGRQGPPLWRIVEDYTAGIRSDSYVACYFQPGETIGARLQGTRHPPGVRQLQADATGKRRYDPKRSRTSVGSHPTTPLRMRPRKAVVV